MSTFYLLCVADLSVCSEALVKYPQGLSHIPLKGDLPKNGTKVELDTSFVQICYVYPFFNNSLLINARIGIYLKISAHQLKSTTH